MKNDLTFGFWAFVVIVVFALAYKGVFYQTSAQWHEVCWYAQHSTKGPQTPEEAAAWNQCDVVSRRAFYEAGLILVPGKPGRIFTKPVEAINEACPVAVDFSQLIIENVVASGGPSLLDKFAPSGWALQQKFKQTWPNCEGARISNGFPRMVEQRGGWFDWASKCGPCDAEAKAVSENSQPIGWANANSN